MYKKIFILLFTLIILLDPQVVQAAPTASALAWAEGSTAATVPRPSYKPYRGNSRHRAKKLGVFRRWALRRKALRKRKRKAQPNIRIEKPTRNR